MKNFVDLRAVSLAFSDRPHSFWASGGPSFYFITIHFRSLNLSNFPIQYMTVHFQYL